MSTIFSDDFESGNGQWTTLGSMEITTAEANDGTHSQTFTGLSFGYGAGASVTQNSAVVGGTTYRFSVAYKTLGDAGFIGIAYLNSGLSIVGGDWLYGDGSYAAANHWDYWTGNLDSSLLDVWKQYSAFTTAPATAVWAFIYDEDYGGSGSQDPLNHPIYFDGISLTSQDSGYWGVLT